MATKAEIVLDSVNPQNQRLTTLVVEFPRYILAQMLTHRVFSRNTSSSRAVPLEKMIERVTNDPVVPVYWGKNQRGMQAQEEVTPDVAHIAEQVWKTALAAAIHRADELKRLDIHKQIANRLLEPFMFVQMLVSATEFNNFFNLRLQDAAQPEIQTLAQAMKLAINKSKPKQLQAGYWHVPFISDEEQSLDLETRLKISTARCARTSYFYHDGGESTVQQDLALFIRLYGEKHYSPFEHQAMATDDKTQHNNFTGWIQQRAFLERQLNPAKSVYV